MMRFESFALPEVSVMEDQQLSALVNRLPARADDEVAIQVIEGRALSKSDDSLHVALPTGLVAVPIRSVVRVTSIPGTKDVVRIVVRNPDGIRHLLRVNPRGATLQARGGESGTRIGDKIGSGVPGPGVQTCDYY